MARSTIRTSAVTLTMAVALAGGLAACGDGEESAAPADPAPAAAEGTGAEEDAPTVEPVQPVEEATDEAATAEPATDSTEDSGTAQSTDDTADSAGDDTTGDEGSDDEAVSRPEDLAAYANEWVVAWGAGDTQTVQRMTDPAALEVLDGFEGDENWEFVELAPVGFPLVTFRNEEAGLSLDLLLDGYAVQHGNDAGVIDIRLTDDEPTPGEQPGNPGDYADTLVQMWGEGDPDLAMLRAYATPFVAQFLFELPGDETTWTRDGEPEPAGETGYYLVDYTGEDGSRLHLMMDPTVLDVGAPAAVLNVQYDPAD